MTASAFVTFVGAAAFLVGCHGGTSTSGTSAPQDGESPAAATASPKVTAPSNGLAVPSASVAAVVNPEALPVYDGPIGIVEGTVLVQGPDAPQLPNLDVSPCPAALDMYGKLFRAGPPRDDGLRPLADAVVVVTGYAGHYVPEKDEAQRVTIGTSCAYPRRTIALTYGQRLEIANDTRLPFAPYLEGIFLAAVMIAPPEQNGEPVKLYPPHVGRFSLRDRMQPFVREEVYVLRQPLHAVSDSRGHFRIDRVPTGMLKVGANLAVIGSEAQKDVEVRENVVQNVEIVLTYSPSDAGARGDAGRHERPIP